MDQDETPSPHAIMARVLDRAIQIAESYGHEVATREHLLVAALEEADVRECVAALGADAEALNGTMEGVLRMMHRHVGRVEPPIVSEALKEVVVGAVGLGQFTPNRAAVNYLWLLAQSPFEDSPAVSALLQAGITSLRVKSFIAHGSATPRVVREGSRKRMLAGGPDAASGDEPKTEAEALDVLNRFCVNLNVEAKEGRIDLLVGRDDEITQIVQITARRTKNNALLVGEPGVGKTALAEGLALRIVREEVPETLVAATVWSLDVGALVAGTRYRGDFEERMKHVLKALTLVPTPVLFIDEVHTIMDAGAGGKGALDVSNLLKPALQKGLLRCIGSTTYEEFRKHFEKDRALMRRFKRVDVGEPTIEQAKDILRGLRPAYEKHHNLSYTDEAIEAAVDLTARYVHTGHLPDKAIDVVDSAGARQRILPPELRLTSIGMREIEAEVARIARIPERDVQEGEADKLSRLEDDLKTAVFGQDRAIHEVADSVLVARAGLRASDKPEGCFLFLGPTGVGKTEVAKQTANTLGIPLIRFDMSEYMEKHAVSRLIGAPPGYVGYGEGGAGNGLLVNAVDQQPRCVLLLDEIEKAHEEVYNILLQVMDAGRLTGASGKPVDFRNVILIMTSNAGVAGSDANPIGFGGKASEVDLDERAIKRIFTPEFRNRLDAVVRFKALDTAVMPLIVDKFIAELRVLAEPRGVTMVITPEARDWLAKQGYEPAFGARPLGRVIHENIKKPLSREMLFGSLRKGGECRVAVQGAGLVLETADAVVA